MRGVTRMVTFPVRAERVNGGIDTNAEIRSPSRPGISRTRASASPRSATPASSKSSFNSAPVQVQADREPMPKSSSLRSEPQPEVQSAAPAIDDEDQADASGRTPASARTEAMQRERTRRWMAIGASVVVVAAIAALVIVKVAGGSSTGSTAARAAVTPAQLSQIGNIPSQLFDKRGRDRQGREHQPSRQSSPHRATVDQRRKA